MNTKITKQFEIEQPIDRVWKSLSDPEDIVGCVPGASITEKIDDKNYKGEVVTKFGPIKAAYAGDIEIVELDEANHKMVLKGRGLDSKGKGSADMIMNGVLSESDGKTHVDFSMDITIIGKLAQFGSRLINDVSDQLLNQFVNNFRDKLNKEGAQEVKVASASASASASTISEGVEPIETPVEKVVKEEVKKEPADNSLDATSLIGTVVKSIFGGLIDSIKSIFGGGKG